jgi:hypothetical protein
MTEKRNLPLEESSRDEDQIISNRDFFVEAMNVIAEKNIRKRSAKSYFDQATVKPKAKLKVKTKPKAKAAL